MKQLLKPLVGAAAILILTAPLALAQMTPAPPPAPAAPGATGSPSTAIPSPPSLPVQKQIDGPVKAVDPAGKTLKVGWMLGLFGTTLQVTDDTQIALQGAKGSLADIREGDEVKASYEAQDGKNVATSIEVTPAAEAKNGLAPSRGSQGAPSPPSSGTSGYPAPRAAQ